MGLRKKLIKQIKKLDEQLTIERMHRVRHKKNIQNNPYFSIASSVLLCGLFIAGKPKKTLKNLGLLVLYLIKGMYMTTSGNQRNAKTL